MTTSNLIQQPVAVAVVSQAAPQSVVASVPAVVGPRGSAGAIGADGLPGSQGIQGVAGADGIGTVASVGTLISSATEKTTPVDADMLGVMDSAAGNVLKKLSWSNIKATLKTYFDTLYVWSSGKAGGQTLNGGTAAGESITITGTASATKSTSGINLGAMHVDEVNGRVGIGTAAPASALDVSGTATISEGAVSFVHMAPPATAPTATINGAAGNITGTNFKHVVTFVTAVGETTAGPVSNTIASVTAGRIDLTNVPTGNSKVTARKIYRVSAAQNSNYAVYVGMISNNTATTYQDNTTEPGFAVNPAPAINTTAGISGILYQKYGTTAAPVGQIEILNTASASASLVFKRHDTVTSRQWALSMGNTGNYDIGFSKVAGAGNLTITSSDNSAAGIAFLGAGSRGTIVSDGSYNLKIDNSWLGHLYLNQAGGGNVQIGTDATAPTALFQVKQPTIARGTVSNAAGGTTVTGSGTAFTSIFKVGDTITIGGQTVAISAIASDTSMTTAAITNANSAVAYTLVGGTRFSVNGNGNTVATQYNLSALNTAPASATDTGTLGEIRVTATYIYVCTATNTWVRAALATW